MPSTRNPEPFLQSASNAAASTVSAPVDLLAWLLRKGGVPVGDKPVGGSDWMTDKGLTKPVEQGAASVAGDVAGNVVQPLAGFAKGAVSAAHLLPALPLLYEKSGNKTLADALRKKIVLAELQYKAGDPVSAILKQTGLFPYPGKLKDLDKQARWGFEIPGKEFPKLDTIKGDMPLSDVYPHQELFDAVPQLADVRMHVGGEAGNKAAWGHYDHYKSTQGAIVLNDKLVKFSPQAARQATYHELNHAINAHTGQLGSLGYATNGVATPEMAETIQKIANYLRQSDPTQKALIADLDKIAKLPGDRTSNNWHKAWQQDAGERLAETDANRTMAQLYGPDKPLAPAQTIYMNRPVSSIAAMAAVHDAIRSKGNTKQDVEYLIEILRNKNAVNDIPSNGP